MPLGLAFILVGMLGGLVLFNTGQVAVDKQRLANAADSAAYSGMVWQARALNFQAYSNRAMVANQVSLGQAVSLNSWAEYARQTSINAQIVLGPIPYVGQFVTTMSQIIQQISQYFIKPIARGMISVIGPINQAVAASQQAMFASSFGATPDIVRDIAKASDSRFSADTAYSALGLAKNLSEWSEFTQTYTLDDTENMLERTEVVNESRDEFTETRYWDFFDNFWVYSTPFTKHKIFREGESRLVMVSAEGEDAEWEWMAVDTVALETRIWRPFRRSRDVEIPMGWGSAYANSNGGNKVVVRNCSRNGFANQPEACKYVDRNNDTAEVAISQIDDVSNYTGLNEFRSISESIKELDDGEAVLRLKTEMSMEIDAVTSSDKYINNREPFATPMISPGSTLSSISVAEVYYRRPEAYASPTASVRLEAANGYNPYWDVRLAPVDKVDRVAALTMRGDLGGGTLPGGVSAEALANYVPPESEGEAGEEGESNGGEQSNLPEYSDITIAAAMGLSGAEADAAIALANGAPEEFIASAIEGFVPVDEITEIIEDELKTQVQEAATNFLESLWNDTLDSAPAGVQQVVDGAVVAAEDAVELAEDLSERFETMREQVQIEFAAELEAQVTSYEEVLVPIVALIGDLTGEFNRVTNEIRNYGENSSGDSRAPLTLRNELIGIQADIDAQRAELDQLKAELKTTMTNYLIDRIAHYGGDLFPELMPFDQMASITDFLLEDYLETPVELRDDVNVDELLPWGEDNDI